MTEPSPSEEEEEEEEDEKDVFVSIDQQEQCVSIYSFIYFLFCLADACLFYSVWGRLLAC